MERWYRGGTRSQLDVTAQIRVALEVHIEPREGRLGEQLGQTFSALRPLVFRTNRLRGFFDQRRDVRWHVDTPRCRLARQLGSTSGLMSSVIVIDN